MFILFVGLCRVAEKSEFKNKQKCQKIAEAQKITRTKIATFTVVQRRKKDQINNILKCSMHVETEQRPNMKGWQAIFGPQDVIREP